MARLVQPSVFLEVAVAGILATAMYVVGQSNQESKETSVKRVSHIEKLDLSFLEKNRNTLGFSHTFDSEVCYYTK